MNVTPEPHAGPTHTHDGLLGVHQGALDGGGHLAASLAAHADQTVAVADDGSAAEAHQLATLDDLWHATNNGRTQRSDHNNARLESLRQPRIRLPAQRLEFPNSMCVLRPQSHLGHAAQLNNALLPVLAVVEVVGVHQVVHVVGHQQLLLQVHVLAILLLQHVGGQLALDHLGASR